MEGKSRVSGGGLQEPAPTVAGRGLDGDPILRRLEGSEGLEEVVINDVALELLLHPVPRAKGVSVPKVEVDLNEGGVHLEGDGSAQYHLLYSSVDA